MSAQSAERLHLYPGADSRELPASLSLVDRTAGDHSLPLSFLSCMKKIALPERHGSFASQRMRVEGGMPCR